MKVNRQIIYFIIIILLGSCNSGNEKKDFDSAISHKLFQLENRGWKSQRITHFVNDMYYSATEVPNEYYLLKSEGNNNLSRIDSLSKNYNRERVIEFEFEQINEDDLLKEEYTAMDYDKSVTYLASTISRDFMAVTSKNDTILCSGVQFERHFKVSPFKRVLLYFGSIDPSEKIQLIYQDRLFNNGIFKFKFNELPFKT